MREIYKDAKVVIAGLREADVSQATAAREMVEEFAGQFQSAARDWMDFFCRYAL